MINNATNKLSILSVARKLSVYRLFIYFYKYGEKIFLNF